MQEGLINGAIFLVNVFFDFLLMFLMLRFILAYARADYFNPITRFIIIITKRIVEPLRRLIPNYKNIEISTLVLLVALDAIKFLLLGFLLYGHIKSPLGLFILSFFDTFKLLINVFFFAIFANVIISWIQQSYSPAGQFFNKLTAPILMPFQRIIPPIGGFDISPIPALIVLQLLIITLVSPMLNIGFAMAFT